MSDTSCGGAHDDQMPSLAGSFVAATMLVAPAHPGAATLDALQSSFVLSAGSGQTLFEQSLPFLVPRFDPSVGTLQAVDISLSRSTIGASLTVDRETSLMTVAFPGSMSAVMFLTVKYSGGDLLNSDPKGVFGPSVGVVIFPDSDAAPDFVGDDALTGFGTIPSAAAASSAVASLRSLV